MTNTQFEAVIGGRAGFRKLLDGTAQELVQDGMLEAEELTSWADFSDERFAFHLIKLLIEVTLDQEDQLEIAAKVMKTVSKAVKQIIQLRAGDPNAEANTDSHRILKELQDETNELRQLAMAA